MERKMVRVVFKLERGGAGNGPAWWAAFKPSDAEIVGEGSGRQVVIKKNAEPRWGPKPDGVRTYLSRRLGERRDGEAWWELEEGTLLRVGAQCKGGWRCATVKSPVLVVEEGAVWEGEDVDGSRWVYIRIEGARPLRLEEVMIDEKVLSCESGI